MKVFHLEPTLSSEAHLTMYDMGNITRKLTFGFVLLILIFFFFSLFSLYGLRTSARLTHTIYNHPLVVSNAALQANVSITKIHRNMKDLVLFKSPERIQQAIAAVEKEEQVAYQQLDIVRDKIIGDAGKNLQQEARTLFTDWQPIRQEVITLVKNGQGDSAAEITIGKGAAHVAALEKNLVALTDYARKKASVFMQEAENTYSRLTLLTIVFLFSAVSLSILIAIVTLRKTASAENELQESRQLLLNAIDHAAIGMVLIDLKGNYRKVNQAFCQLIGYSEQELAGMSFQDVTHPDDHYIGPNFLNKLIAGEVDQTIIEKRYIKKDGRTIDAYLTTSMLRDAKGSPTYFFTQIQDFTERKKLSEELRQEQATLKTALESMTDAVSITDNTGKISHYNNAFATFHKFRNKEECSKEPTDLHAILDVYLPNGELAPHDMWVIPRALRGETYNNVEYMLQLKATGVKWFGSYSFAPIHAKDGSIVGSVVVGRDITEHKLTALRIQHLNRVLRAIRDVNQLIVRERDPEVLIREGCKLLVDNRGYSSAFIVLFDREGRFSSWAGAGNTISSKKLNTMLENGELPECYRLCTSTEDLLLIDEQMSVCGNCPISGQRAKTFSLCTQLVHEDNTFGFIVATLADDTIIADEERSLFAEMAGDLAYALNYIRMEAEHTASEHKRKNLQQQLNQAQKMESVGRLAGGVAHDYNNMLSIILGYAELLMEKMGPSNPLYTDLQEIQNAGKRSVDITRQLLAFARQQTVAPTVLDLNDNIESMLKMLRRLIGEDLDLAWLPGNNIWPVKIDPTQVDQILANLCVNARDAIQGVGKITIETKNISLDKEYCADHIEALAGEYVLLAVSDNGIGMDPETQAKIFEPFYTTKGIHEGTGLGLSTVYGIVKQNNGFIYVYSEPGEGTTIKVYLPRHSGQTVQVLRTITAEVPLGQGETVLLVEDDPSILKLVSRILKDLGYNVLCANMPSEAIKLFEQHTTAIDLLLTDVVMPEINGRDLSQQFQKKCPNLKTLFMSGYTANVIAHRGVLDKGLNFIQKPLSKRDLAVKISKIIQEDMS